MYSAAYKREVTLTDTVQTENNAEDAAPAIDTDAGADTPLGILPATEELSLEPDANAPYGYMIDPDTGLRRPKIRAGRRRKTAIPPQVASPSAEQLDAQGPIKRGEDRPPAPRGKKARGKTSTKGSEGQAAAVPPFRAGPIATGMNKLYAAAGKIVRAWDHDIGTAIIGTTRKESDDDTTVGEAWEELARTNPRIRAFLYKMIEGGAWSGVFMAHAPIFLAVLMKEGIRKRLPFQGLLSSLLDSDQDGPSEVSQMFGGVQAPDMQQMWNLAADLMANMPRSATINPSAPGFFTPAPTINDNDSVIPGMWGNDQNAGSTPESEAP
jgi:hypothetical protein